MSKKYNLDKSASYTTDNLVRKKLFSTERRERQFYYRSLCWTNSPILVQIGGFEVSSLLSEVAAATRLGRRTSSEEDVNMGDHCVIAHVSHSPNFIRLIICNEHCLSALARCPAKFTGQIARRIVIEPPVRLL